MTKTQQMRDFSSPNKKPGLAYGVQLNEIFKDHS